MKLNELSKIADTFKTTPRMPVLFLGHGSPMNAIEENEFVQGFRKVSSEIFKPNTILCVSAHWETRGTKVTAMKNPRTIHDFGGFPQELFKVQYPVSGSPELALETKEIITSTSVDLDNHWGLDHGAWSVLKHMYPNADVPVIQLSLDIYKNPKAHYQIAKELSKLRDKGVLIVGSGNMVHNLRKADWTKLDENYGYDWAQVANEKMKTFLLDGNHDALINFKNQGRELNLSIPTAEHFLPLLYTIALQDKNEKIEVFNDKFVGGSLSMTSLKIA
ncbi:4,5-DOPA-extradiol-dioxygenase [Seonamhaeicola marinus]